MIFDDIEEDVKYISNVLPEKLPFLILLFKKFLIILILNLFLIIRFIFET